MKNMKRKARVTFEIDFVWIDYPLDVLFDEFLEGNISRNHLYNLAVKSAVEYGTNLNGLTLTADEKLYLQTVIDDYNNRIIGLFFEDCSLKKSRYCL